MNKVENSGAPFIPMTTPDVGTVVTTNGYEHEVCRETFYQHNGTEPGCSVPSTEKSSSYPYYPHSSGDCNVTYSSYLNPLPQPSHHHYPHHHHHPNPSGQHHHHPNPSGKGGSAIMDNPIPHLARNSIALGSTLATCGNPVVTSSQHSLNLMNQTGGNMSFLSMLRDSTATEMGAEVLMDLGYSKATNISNGASKASDWPANGDLESIAVHTKVPGTPQLPTILEEM